MTDKQNDKRILRLIPNALTIGRIVMTFFFLGILLYANHAQNRTLLLDIAFVLFVIAGLTDIVDGKVARHFNVTSKFGRIMDPLADKLLICGAFLCFAIVGEPKLFNLTGATLSAIHWGTFAIITAREILVTIMRHISESRGISFPAVASGKLKMFLQSFAIGTVMVKIAHVQTATWANYFTAVVFIAMIASTIISGLGATKRLYTNENA